MQFKASIKYICKSELFPEKLTHWGWVMHICISKITIISSDNGLSPGSAPSHYLNQCWNIVNWTPKNKPQWNFNRNWYIFIQKNSFKNVVWKMAAILSWPQCVKQWAFSSPTSEGFHSNLTTWKRKSIWQITHEKESIQWPLSTHCGLVMPYGDIELGKYWLQAITWTNANVLPIGYWGAIFIDILIKILKFSFKKMYSRILTAQWRTQCVLILQRTAPYLYCIFFHLIMAVDRRGQYKDKS